MLISYGEVFFLIDEYPFPYVIGSQGWKNSFSAASIIFAKEI